MNDTGLFTLVRNVVLHLMKLLITRVLVVFMCHKIVCVISVFYFTGIRQSAIR